MSRTALVVFTIIAIAGSVSPSRAATAFMYIDGVAGNSPTDRTHTDWVDLTRFSVPVQKDQPATLGGLGPMLGDIVIGKMSDENTLILQNAANDGTSFPVIKIDLCTNCKKGVPPGPDDIFFIGEWTAEVAEFANFEFEGTNERVEITFESIKYKYFKEDKDGNKIDGSFIADWFMPTAPPSTSTEGSPTGPFMLFDEVFIPEPATALAVGVGTVVLGMRRREV